MLSLDAAPGGSAPCLVIVGGSGFIGRRLLAVLAARAEPRLRALVHRQGLTVAPGERVEAVEGDLLAPATLEGLLEPGCVVVNLSFLSSRSRSENLAATENLAAACIRSGARRLVHCSTAVVAGNTGPGLVDEQTPCRPFSEYERTKLEIEELLLSRARGSFEVAILRPTAVFGPGGRNLLRLADGLCKGSALKRYLKSCLFNRRSMNLVCLDNVVAALIFLAGAGGETDGQVFIVSDDDSPMNNYRDVELMLRAKLGMAPCRLPRLPVPAGILRRLLSMAGRPTADPEVRYTCAKLLSLGFKKTCSLEEGISQFAAWYEKECQSRGAEAAG
jgi:nucleoside-diphosphate-sugar epimerase